MIRVYRGAPYGSPILTVHRGLVFEGRAVSGAPLYTITGDALRQGFGPSGRILANLRRDLVFAGVATSGAPLATIRGDHAFEGLAVSGRILVSASPGDPRAVMAGVWHVLR